MRLKLQSDALRILSLAAAITVALVLDTHAQSAGWPLDGPTAMPLEFRQTVPPPT